MPSKVLPLVIIFSLVACWNATAQERIVAGEVLVAPMQVDVKGNGAKFNEYRDLRNGAYGHIGLNYEAGENYIDFRADHMGYRDQKYELEGGKRGSFSYYLSYDEIPHNFASGTAVHR